MFTSLLTEVGLNDNANEINKNKLMNQLNTNRNKGILGLSTDTDIIPLTATPLTLDNASAEFDKNHDLGSKIGNQVLNAVTAARN